MSTITKHYERNKRGVIWADIELNEVEGGLSFTSPVDGYVSKVAGLTLKEFESNAWYQGQYWYDILEAIADSGGGEWYVIDGGTTTYDYFQREGKHYLFVEERNI
jgi:hypothetical protein